MSYWGVKENLQDAMKNLQDAMALLQVVKTILQVAKERRQDVSGFPMAAERQCSPVRLKSEPLSGTRRRKRSNKMSDVS